MSTIFHKHRRDTHILQSLEIPREDAEFLSPPLSLLIPRPKGALDQLVKRNHRIAHCRPPLNVVDRDSMLVLLRSAIATAQVVIVRVLRTSAVAAIVRGT